MEKMTPKQFIEKLDNGYIAGDYIPGEVYYFMENYAIIKQIEENESILAMAKLHMDERAILIIKERISSLENKINKTFDNNKV